MCYEIHSSYKTESYLGSSMSLDIRYLPNVGTYINLFIKDFNHLY